MPGLLPIILTSSYIVLAADKIPELNIEPTCRAAATTNVRAVANANQDTSACKRDENDARGKVEQEWSGFSADDRSHCVRLSTLGGSPSYVELLTCLELSKQARALPSDIHPAGSSKP
jgi:hypothetical protein